MIPYEGTGWMSCAFQKKKKKSLFSTFSGATASVRKGRLRQQEGRVPRVTGGSCRSSWAKLPSESQDAAPVLSGSEGGSG